MKKDSGLFRPVEEHFDKHGKEYKFVHFEYATNRISESSVLLEAKHSDGGFSSSLRAAYMHGSVDNDFDPEYNRAALRSYIMSNTAAMYCHTGYSKRRMEELFRVANMIIKLMVDQMKKDGDADAESFARDCIKEAMKEYHRGNDGTKWTTTKQEGGL